MQQNKVTFQFCPFECWRPIARITPEPLLKGREVDRVVHRVGKDRSKRDHSPSPLEGDG